MTAKELLLHQTRLAFEDDPEMSLKASLQGVTDEMAGREPTGGLSQTIADIVWHVGWCKLWYCQQAFGFEGSLEEPASFADKLRRLDEAQAHLLKCIEGCMEERFAEPVETQFDEGAEI